MEKARKDYLKWDEYFLAIAKIAEKRSKDPSTQVGAVIVNSDRQIIATGYNGFPRGLDDDAYLWDRENENWELTKYPYVVHAESNAILNSTRELKGASIYVSLFPCNECAKLIVQSGIVKVIYADDKYDGTPINNVSKKILKNSGVELVQIPDVDVKVTRK
jgi:dCMP deaminase